MLLADLSIDLVLMHLKYNSFFADSSVYIVTEKRWSGLKEMSDERRRSLESLVEDLKEFRETHDQLENWLAQKEKMVSLLGPVAMEPAMVNNQLQQVQLLQEEMTSHQPQYEQFQQAGYSVLDKCDAESDDTRRINEHLDTTMKHWDELSSKLEDREQSLKDILAVSERYYQLLQGLSEWLVPTTEKVDSLPPVSTQPEIIKEQKAEMQELLKDVAKRDPEVEEARQLCRQLSDSTKEPSTKFDIKNKLTNVDKPFQDIKKKLGRYKRRELWLQHLEESYQIILLFAISVIMSIA